MTAVEMGGTLEFETVGRYRLLFEIASGGMASVHLARAEGPGGFEKLVALKRIRPQLAHDAAFVEMFLDEARIASRITHPNVCQVFDFGEDAGQYFIAMEHLLGETVGRALLRLASDEPLRRDPRLPGLSARILADACEGLHAAHELSDDSGRPMGLVHRDISPANLLVTYEGSVKVMDFGIARAAGRLHTTQSHGLKGKLAYMAPERFGDDEVDRRSDIWSLGVVAWELLTGRKLFGRSSESKTVGAILSGKVPPPSKYAPGLDPQLERVVLRALAVDPEDRFATARDMGRALNEFLRLQAVPATMAELAEWMDELFAARRQERLDMIDIARSIDQPETVARSPLSGSDTIVDARDETPSTSGVSLRNPAADVAGPAAVPSRSRGPGLVVGGLVMAAAVALAAALALGFGLGGDGDGPGRVAPRASPPASPAPPPGVVRQRIRHPGAPAAPAPPAPLPVAAPEAAPLPAPVDPPPDVATADAAPGTVRVSTPGGWADVYLGAQRVGRTPTRVELAPGDHVLQLHPFGRRPARRVRVQVAPGETRAVVVRLAVASPD